MHGLTDQPKFDHRAVVLHEPRIRCPARGRQFRRHPRLCLHRLGDQIGQITGGRDKAFARYLDLQFDLHAKAVADRGGLLFQPCGQAVARMHVVKADVHRRAGFSGDHIGRGVAGIDRHNRQRRRVEMISPVVKGMRGKLVHQPHHRGHRIVGAVGIGRVTLFADHAEMRVQGPAPPDFNHLAHRIGTGRLTHQTNVHPLARVFHVIQQGAGAVDAFGFLVSGDRQHNRSVGRCITDKVDGRRSKGGHTGFHIGGAAPVHNAVFDLCAKGRHRPVGLVPDGHDIGVTVKAKATGVSLLAPTRKKVLDPATVGPRTVKTRIGQ